MTIDKNIPVLLKLITVNGKIAGKEAAQLHSVGDDSTSYKGNQSSRVITFKN